jgi:hypothetical protein
MPEQVERGQSPPPERSSGKQMHDVPASGKGTDNATHKEDANKEAIEVGTPCLLSRYSAANSRQHLTSNPRGPMEDEVDKKFEKGFKPSA